MRDVVLNATTPFVPLVLERRGKQFDYSAKAVSFGKLRYIVCVNRIPTGEAA